MDSHPLWIFTLFLIFSLLVALSICSNVFSQEIVTVQTAGECRDFTVTLNVTDLTPGCWDVKLALPGKIQTRDSDKWKSAFFYVEDAICFPETEAKLKVKLDTSETPIYAKAKIRQNNTIIEKDFTIYQKCPEPLSDLWAILVLLIIILVFGWSLTWWWRQGHVAGEHMHVVKGKSKSSKKEN